MTAAFAHDGSDHASELDLGWSFELWIVGPIVAVALLYAIGGARLGLRGGAERRASAILFWSGLIALALALVSPLHAYGTRIFFLHMVEHEILMVIAVPLMVAARPAAALLWGLPSRLRAIVVRLVQMSAMQRIGAAASELAGATILHAAVLWLWHLPILFEAASAHEGVHLLQHLSFVLSAILFWAAVLDRDHRRYGQGGAVVALFLTSLQAGMLGAVLTLSARVWYPNGPDPFDLSGLTRSEDQILAGLIMWVPACAIYILAALIMLARWLTHLEAPRGAMTP